MDLLRDYILSLVCGAILCGILLTLTGEKGTAAGILKLACGAFLCLTVVKPIVSIRPDQWNLTFPDLTADGKAASAMGEDWYQNSMEAIITENARTYILDKATDMGLALTVQIALREDSVPDEVVLTGDATQNQKEELAQIIHSELGIPKEHQIWIGS